MHAASYLSVSNSRLNRVVFVSKQGNKLLFFDVITDALEAYIVATTLSRWQPYIEMNIFSYTILHNFLNLG